MVGPISLITNINASALLFLAPLWRRANFISFNSCFGGAIPWKSGFNVFPVPGRLSAMGESPLRTENRTSSWKGGFYVFLVPGRLTATREFLPRRIEQAVGRAASMCSLFQGDQA
jgi:hypothetical protein